MEEKYYSCLVFMATFNGQKYVEDQIRSILNQVNCEVTLMISDDCSTDNTWGILQKMAENHPNILISRNETNQGFAKNFLNLVYNNIDKSYDFFALSDQDDVWEENKLHQAILSLKKNNKSFYFSNLLMVDEQLNTIRKMNDISILNRNYLAENICTGCTIVFSKEFCPLIRKEYIYLHDYWLFLIAWANECWFYDNNTYIKYRQHSNNAIGGNVKKRRPFSIRLRGFTYEIFKRNVREQSRMLKLLYFHFKTSLSGHTCKILNRISKINIFWNRIILIFSHDFRKANKKENFIFKMKLLVNKF